MNARLADQAPVLSLVDARIAYGDNVALSDVTLSIAAGEKLALIGRSGAGKTSLLRRLYQLDPERCAFIHQQQALVPQLSVFHNIFMGRLDAQPLWLNLVNLVRPMARFRAEIGSIAASLGLTDKLFVRVGELSGGQQQRVGIGRALYRGGSILMADEPVSSLDMVQREEIMQFIAGAGTTVVSSLHSVELARRYFERIVGLKDRKILFDLPAAAVSDSHLAELYG